ncbi:hypothetical protein D9758_004695 [Tetrapyrgos nigripes]|uniref:Uncharacterized protein n=1 Tax=Tetrapyrgos nigripes TaxID=182062 RepID=A0A8H5H063_9AGAR|nr:hypothetical protein D9758_004695 [Tetrapyrgos nigripes]
MYKLASISALAFAGLASAQNVIDVQVGSTQDAQGGIFQFIPNNVKASKNDVVRFRFTGAPGNHRDIVSVVFSVTQSSLAKPCDNLENGFDSGWVLIPTAAAANPAPEWNLTIIDDSKPLWFYCKAPLPVPHCGIGMIGAINADDTAMASFQQTANGNKNPGQAVGALVGQGASASAPPGPLTNGAQAFGVPSATAASGGDSGSGSDSGSTPSPTAGDDGNGALTLYISGLAALFAAVMGITLA